MPKRFAPLSEIISKNRLIPARKFVSRGGDKLQGALNHFKIEVEGSVCLDIGSATGGFADCLLKNGAGKVYCVDVAYGKLDWKLRNDSRIVNLERRNFRSLQKEEFAEPVEFACIDISFSSCRNALIKTKEIIKQGARVLVLFKPQFEVPSRYLVKGILKNNDILEKSMSEFKEFVGESGMRLLGHAKTGLKGRKGNQEYFFCIS